MKGKKILFIASNYGLWAEELQAPWDALKEAGHNLTLATYKGMTPLPIKISMDPDIVDPMQNIHVNPPEVIKRVNEILDNGEWSNTIKISDAKMEDYDALVLVGGPGSAVDITGNMFVHKLVLNAYKNKKIIAALCYAVGAFAFTRDPDNRNRSIIYGKTVAAHPHAWDFDVDLDYDVVRETPENPGIKLRTCGFLYPLQYMIEDAVGPEGSVKADPSTTRERPCVIQDGNIITGLSIESSVELGKTLVKAL